MNIGPNHARILRIMGKNMKTRQTGSGGKFWSFFSCLSGKVVDAELQTVCSDNSSDCTKNLRQSIDEKKVDGAIVAPQEELPPEASF
ncbi:DgyrCDS13952 [Dimorphilus gyrociliatus]|uniref:DgyrCDS13952 n=1 Tax=Dimorphilus gyrociliatus TaxID=2664684 RepID=A0A7I8WC48_9ANNE|nr:DgyrCDS13952 [Dimorphilus gyrociliatus]